MDIHDFRNLYEYNAWANHRASDACAALSPEQFARNLASSFPSVKDTLAHIMGAEWIWLERWSGASPTSFMDASQLATVAAIRERWEPIERGLQDYVHSLSPADLQTTLQYKSMAGKAFAQPLWQTLQHLANHSTYHRGQITTMLRQLGATPVSTDMVAFYRERATTTASA
jgi:uncharacterized damage-inducible protein DinB